MPFNTTNGFIPRTAQEILQDYKTSSSAVFPNEDFSDYENGNLYLVHYADMQNTLSIENTLVNIEEAFYTWLANEENQIKTSKIGTQNGILSTLFPFVNNQQVVSINPEAGVLEIYGDFTNTEETPADWEAIAKAIFNSKGAGIFTQNALGKTNTDPVPIIPEEDMVNKIVPVADAVGLVTHIYFSVATLKPCSIKIQYNMSNSNLQVLNSTDVLAESFLQGLAKLDNFGNPLFGIGKDFEPEKYLNPSDHPFASDFNIQWSLDGENYTIGVRQWVKGELLVFEKSKITVEVL